MNDNENSELYDENCQIYGIMRDVIKFIHKKGCPRASISLYEELKECYNYGFIPTIELPRKNSRSNIDKIEIKDNYIIISFPFISMIASQEFVEDYLCEMWCKTRKAFQRYSFRPEIKFIKGHGYGVKLQSYAAIGGDGYNNAKATLYTPEDFQELLDNYSEKLE